MGEEGGRAGGLGLVVEKTGVFVEHLHWLPCRLHALLLKLLLSDAHHALRKGHHYLARAARLQDSLAYEARPRENEP